MITTSYELLSSCWRRHMRRLRKRSSTRCLRRGLRAREHGERVDTDRAPTEVVPGVGDDRPHVFADRPSEQVQVAILDLADHDPGLAGDRPWPQRAGGGDVRGQIDRAA